MPPQEDAGKPSGMLCELLIERMDDVSLIWAHLKAMGIAEEIDAHFHPHGNWDSSLGKTVAVWLTYILLARALRYLAQDEVWGAFEEALNRRLLLPTATVRVDTSTVSTYAEVTPEGLVQFGFSKDHRPDLPQVKVGLASLEPLGMPLATRATLHR